MGSLDNLSKPGHTNNPKGRPKDRESFSGILRELVNQQKVEFTLINKDGKEKHFYAEASEGKTIKQVLMAMQVSRALAGNDKAIERVMERIEGKVAQSVKLELPEGRSGKIDLSKLKKPEIEQLKSLLKKAHSGDKE